MLSPVFRWIFLIFSIFFSHLWIDATINTMWRYQQNAKTWNNIKFGIKLLLHKLILSWSLNDSIGTPINHIESQNTNSIASLLSIAHTRTEDKILFHKCIYKCIENDNWVTLSLIILRARIQIALPVCCPPPRLYRFTIQFPTEKVKMWLIRLPVIFWTDTERIFMWT